MSRLTKFGVILTVAAIMLTSVADAAIRRVPARLNVFELYGGYLQPMGTVEGPVFEFDDPDFGITNKFIVDNRIIDVDAEDVWEPSFYFGLKWGSTFAERLMGKIGFQYSRYELKDPIQFETESAIVTYGFGPLEPNYNQFDVTVDLNIYAGNPLTMPFNPYVGIGLQAGILSISFDDFETEYHTNVAASANFGLDIKLAESQNGRNFWVLASDNRYDFYSSNDRPRNLQIGGAIRYFFRM